MLQKAESRIMNQLDLVELMKRLRRLDLTVLAGLNSKQQTMVKQMSNLHLQERDIENPSDYSFDDSSMSTGELIISLPNNARDRVSKRLAKI